MKLSAPVYHLKRKAKLLSREDKIPLHEALDRVAQQEGFSAWSLLVAQASLSAPATKLFPRLTPGDLVLLGARPGHGKTLMSLELAVEAMRAGSRSAFFSLEFTDAQVRSSFRGIGVEPDEFGDQFCFDGSEAICADYIVAKLADAERGTLVVVDYLQLLDQRRDTPELSVQIRVLKSFARERGLIIVFISQIARTYDPDKKSCPDLEDVRLPNPLDLKLFDKTCFLNDTEVQFRSAS